MVPFLLGGGVHSIIKGFKKRTSQRGACFDGRGKRLSKSSTTSFAIGLFYPGADARQQIPLKRKRQTLTGLPFRVPIHEPTAYFIAVTRLPSRDLYLAAVFPCSVPFWIALSSAETVWR